MTDHRTCTEQGIDDHNESVARALGWYRYVRTDGTIWINPDLEDTR